MVGNISFRFMIFHACLIFTAIKISAVNSECVDMEPFKFEGNENTICAGQDCSKNRVATNCPLTCGTCVPEAGVSSGSDSDCVDIEPFTFQGDDNTMCAGQDCNKNRVETNCPLTCGTCGSGGDSGGGSGSDTGGDSGSGSGSGGDDSEQGITCVDLKKKFKVPGQNGKKKCKGWKSICTTNTKVSSKCPDTCGLCGPPTPPPTTPCVDASGKFKIDGSGKKSCKQVKKKKKKFCEKPEAQVSCPVTCDTCPKSSSSTPSPTKLPSASPTASPSASPTATPSASPSSSPTGTPSTLPSSGPTETVCTLAGRIEFPDTETQGYHSSSLRVSKSNWNAVCSSRREKTGWGCVHDGEAKTGNWADDSIGCNEVETATIEYAQGGTFNFTMEHVFDYKELYYEGDHTIRPELTISANGVDLDTVRYPKNTNTDTHIGEFVNGEYKGIVFANAVCNDLCNCTVERVMPVCPIRAEIQYPTLKDAKDNGLRGHHNDAISVFQDGEECSKDNRLTKWCVHEGDAEFYYDYYDDDYYDRFSTESISIPEAANGNFSFRVDHDMTEDEIYYYGDDSSIAGKLQLWIGNEDRGKHSHWVENKWEDTFYIDVKCDDTCHCDVEKRKYPVCKIDAKVRFPNKENMDYYGYKNDCVTVQKSGKDEICAWENLEETSWGCLHDGDAMVWYGKDGSFLKETESVTIDNGADGEFRFTLQHYPSENELYYPNDHKLHSTMSISINDDEEPQKFHYPQSNDTDTHLPDGSVNHDYKGTVYVDVKCDSLCNCDMIEHVPTCELDAVLSFPDFTERYYGYNADIFSVTKEGEEGACGYDSYMTEWGCFGSGDAYITDYPIDLYYNHKSTQTLKIPDASNSTFYFTVEHYASDFDPLYYDSYKHKSELNITVNGVDQGTFKHKKNTTAATNPDGTVSEEYTSEIVVIVSCDDACACEAEKQEES